MSENEAFYYHQNRLFGDLYTRPVNDSDFDKVQLLNKMVGKGPMSILELGDGGGQHAFAMAEDGNAVTAVELQSQFADYIDKLSKEVTKGSLKVINDSFYTVEISNQFDVVTYWDGFGIGADEEQILLLKRICDWLKPSGAALIDVYTPWHAQRMNGKQMRFKDVVREYNYDEKTNRWSDTWWDTNKPTQKYTQSLRCYSVEELLSLLSTAGLKLGSDKG